MLQAILKGSVPSASIAHARKFLSTVPEVRVLEATRRVESGSRVSRKARAQGLVPSVLYGPGPSGKQESVMIYLRQYDIKSELRHMKAAFENTIYKLVVDGEEFRVLPKQLTMHPSTFAWLFLNSLNNCFVCSVRRSYPCQLLPVF